MYMMVLKRKQIVVLSLVIMIVIAGYLQYSYKKSSETADNQTEKGRMGEAVYVDGDVGSQAGLSGGEKDIDASKKTGDFFASAKLDREISRSRETDNLREITEDNNASTEIKAEAYNKMIKIIDNSDKEMRIENLIKEKGYKDVLTLFADDGSVDVIIKTQGLSSSQVAQIADIVSRHADVEISDIHLKPLF